MVRLIAAIAGAAAVLAPAPAAYAAGAGPCLPAATTVRPGVPWAQDLLGPQRIWPLTRGGGVTVAVVDTGVDAVPQLAGRVTGTRTDCAGHGTFVAGIVAAAPADGAGFTGLAPAATVLSVAVTADASRRPPQAQLAAGIRTAAAQGADVIAVALPLWRAGDELLSAVQEAARHDALVVVPALAPQDGDPALDPRLLDLVLAVGGMDAQGAPVADTAAPADLLAPAAEIVSTGPRGPGHLAAGGTGYAVPFAAGAAALVRAYHPDLTAAQVKRRLTVTARTAGGVLDAYAAVTAVLPEELGTRPAETAPRPVTVAAPVRSDRRALVVAAYAVGAAVAVLAGLAVLAVLLPRARRRGRRAVAR
ncbi:peptidase S8 [Catellatospora sp. TT07R-123]|uniref:S8 family serine peptidase n=1 Tax=Catellatospora sp. TT07R-123 TaxID=2733863 RepID=UPI001B09BF7E|nr:S8 family serine peptidase [Catellatospora sp. TT07R-123]GHJ46941.1 peptidase S8 [Catellatospora sp. TT07R-123]